MVSSNDVTITEISDGRVVLDGPEETVVVPAWQVAALREYFVQGAAKLSGNSTERMPEDVREIVDEAREFANHPEEHAEHDLIRRLADALEAAYSQKVEPERNTSLRDLYPEPW